MYEKHTKIDFVYMAEHSVKDTIEILLEGDETKTVAKKVARDYNNLSSNKSVPIVAYVLGHHISAGHLESNLRKIIKISIGEEHVDATTIWKPVWSSFIEQFGTSVPSSKLVDLYDFANKLPVVNIARQSAIQAMYTYYHPATATTSDVEVKELYTACTTALRNKISQNINLDHRHLHEIIHLCMFRVSDIDSLITEWNSCPNTDHTVHFAKKFFRDTGHLPNKHDIERFQKFMKDPMAIIGLYMERVRSCGPSDILLVISEVFKRIMKRDPIVHELQYIFYRTQGSTQPVEIETETTKYSNIYKEYINVYENVRKEYLATPFDPNDFARILVQHAHHSTVEFVAIVQDACVSCEEYTALVDDRVQTLVKDFTSDHFDQVTEGIIVITKDDLKYMTNRVRASKLSYLSEDTVVLLKKLLEHHRISCEKIHLIYNARLKRRAEESEIMIYINHFRNIESLENDNRDLLNVLENIDNTVVNSLEFHDILKDYIEKEKQQLSRAQVFSVLTDIVNKGAAFYSDLEKVSVYLQQNNIH